VQYIVIIEHRLASLVIELGKTLSEEMNFHATDVVRWLESLPACLKGSQVVLASLTELSEAPFLAVYGSLGRGRDTSPRIKRYPWFRYNINKSTLKSTCAFHWT
jgi:hypothetical protein